MPIQRYPILNVDLSMFRSTIACITKFIIALIDVGK